MTILLMRSLRRLLLAALVTGAVPVLTGCLTGQGTSAASETVKRADTATPTPSQWASCTLFVARRGSDWNPGTLAAPFATVQQGVSVAGPGAVICVGDGIYPESVTFNRSGTPFAWITLRSLNPSVNGPGGGATISPASSSGTVVNPNGHSYIEIDHLVVTGGLWGIVGTGGNHIRVIGNIVSNAGAAGIGFVHGDYYDIEHNIVHDCAKTWTGNSSGISIYQPVDADILPGFHISIRYNISYNNSNPPPHGTDGSGIVIDDFNHTQSDNVPYTGHTLVEENLTYNNGGSGIRVGYSSRVAVRNNTSFWNESLTTVSGSWRGELATEYSNGIIWVNNIAVANPAFNRYNTAILDAASTGSIWLNNLTFDGTAGNASVNNPSGVSMTDNLLGKDPRLVNPPTDSSLRPGSPAIGAGTSSYGFPAVDFNGNSSLSGPSIGAFR